MPSISPQLAERGWCHLQRGGTCTEVADMASQNHQQERLPSRCQMLHSKPGGNEPPCHCWQLTRPSPSMGTKHYASVCTHPSALHQLLQHGLGPCFLQLMNIPMLGTTTAGRCRSGCCGAANAAMPEQSSLQSTRDNEGRCS